MGRDKLESLRERGGGKRERKASRESTNNLNGIGEEKNWKAQTGLELAGGKEEDERQRERARRKEDVDAESERKKRRGWYAWS